jgi:Transposase DDE domain
VLLYSGLDQSLREVAASFTENGCRLSDEAVRRRLSGCEEWLEKILLAMIPKQAEISTGGLRFKIVDSTTIQAPGAVNGDYRLHLLWDHDEQRLGDVLLTDCKTGENLQLFEWHEGDVVLADAGFAKAEQLAAVKTSGAEYVVRCATKQIRLYLPDGERLNVVNELKAREVGQRVISMSVMIGSKAGPQRAWLHAYRLPEEKAREVRRRLKRRVQKKYGGRINEELLYLSDWTLLLTSLSPDKVSADVVGKLYRGRWQIEIVIKRLKSVLDLGALRARRGSRLAKVYLLGKLLYALMIERQALRFKQNKDVTWRLWKVIASRMRASITFPNRLDRKMSKDVLIVLKERPRKRKSLRVKLGASIKALHATYYRNECLQR